VKLKLKFKYRLFGILSGDWKDRNLALLQLEVNRKVSEGMNIELIFTL